MLTFLGILLLVALGVFWILKSFLKKSTPPALQLLADNKKLFWGLVFGALVLTLSDGLFFIAKPGTAYAVQYWWGGDQAVSSQGVKAQWFGRTIPISFEIAIQDTIGVHETQDEIYYRPGIEREFSDAIKARIATSLIVSINYQNEEQFLQTADKNRSEAKLVHSRIIPTYDQAVKNTCKLLSAQEYIAGASSQFDFYLRDQLQHGMYMTEETFEVEEEQPISDSTVTRNVKSKQTNLKKQRRYIIKKNRSNGEPLRDTTNSLARYGLTVQQVAVTHIDWEGSFDTRLDAQKDQVAKTQLKKQEAETEYYATQTAIQKGEREKAEEQKKLEKEQIKVTMAAETAGKVAEWKKTEEENLYQASKKTAERIRVESDANFYKNSRMVSAGLTPQEKAYWAYRSDSVQWAYRSQMKLPQVWMAGGAGGSGVGVMEQMIGAKLAEGLLKSN